MRKKRILTEEHKKKISIAQQGKKKTFSPAAIENIRKAAAKRKGIKKGPRTEEDKEKIRQATIGKKKTIINDNPGWFKQGIKPLYGFKKGHISWNLGKTHSKETIEKLAKANRKRGKGRNSWNYKQWKKSVLSYLHGKMKCNLKNGKKFFTGQTPWIEGRKHTIESREKMKNSHIGQVPWNKKKINITVA